MAMPAALARAESFPVAGPGMVSAAWHRRWPQAVAGNAHFGETDQGGALFPGAGHPRAHAVEIASDLTRQGVENDNGDADVVHRQLRAHAIRASHFRRRCIAPDSVGDSDTGDTGWVMTGCLSPNPHALQVVISPALPARIPVQSAFVHSTKDSCYDIRLVPYCHSGMVLKNISYLWQTMSQNQ